MTILIVDDNEQNLYHLEHFSNQRVRYGFCANGGGSLSRRKPTL